MVNLFFLGNKIYILLYFLSIYCYILQIVVGGRNKYLINGKLAQPSQVQNLFHSVQLNVNNPHFLIMQGRITKVLNMKPPEILSMLEEAAGTRMYETKKESALKTLEKKQSKVDEINKLLDQEILPALEKLRKERTQYMQWANGNAELDRLKRFCIAYEFVQAERIKDNAVCGVEQVKARIAETDDNMGTMWAEIQEMETELSKLTAEKEASMGGQVKSLSEKVDAISQDLVREVSALNNKEDTLKSEKENAEKVSFTSQTHFILLYIFKLCVFVKKIKGSHSLLFLFHSISSPSPFPCQFCEYCN